MMDTNVGKTDYKVIKTYPLRIKVTATQEELLWGFVNEYQKVANFVLQKFFKEIKPNIRLLQEPIEGICPLCNIERKTKVNKKGVKTGGLGYEIKLPDGCIQPNCGCIESHFSLRKLFLPSSKYKLADMHSIPDFDMRFAGKLYPGEVNMVQGGDSLRSGYNHGIYDTCLKKVSEIIRSQKALNENIDSRIEWLNERNNEIEIEISRRKKGVTQEQASKQKNKKSKLVEYDTDKLVSFRKKNDKKLIKLRSKKADEAIYKAHTIRLPPDCYSWERIDDEYYLNIKKIFSNPLLLDFYGTNYQKKKAGIFAQSKKQPEIELIRRNQNYFLHYIYKERLPLDLPAKDSTVVGINVGILNVYTMACLKQGQMTAFNVKFINGRPMRRELLQFYKVRRIWQTKMKLKNKGGQGRSKKWYYQRLGYNDTDIAKILSGDKGIVIYNKEQEYMKSQLHKYSSDMTNYINETCSKPVVILPDFTYLSEQIDKMKQSHKKTMDKRLKGKYRKWYLKDRYLNKELSSFPYKKLMEWLQYKLAWLGIPVVIMPKMPASIKCNNCGHIMDELTGYDLHTLNFHCENCGYKCNLDYNNAINMAKTYQEYYKDDNYELCPLKVGKDFTGAFTFKRKEAKNDIIPGTPLPD